jgi:hypothetical protein
MDDVKIHIYALYICLVMNTRTCTKAWCVCAVHLYYFNIRLILEEISLPPVLVFSRLCLSLVATIREYEHVSARKAMKLGDNGKCQGIESSWRTFLA